MLGLIYTSLYLSLAVAVFSESRLWKFRIQTEDSALLTAANKILPFQDAFQQNSLTASNFNLVRDDLRGVWDEWLLNDLSGRK